MSLLCNRKLIRLPPAGMNVPIGSDCFSFFFVFCKFLVDFPSAQPILSLFDKDSSFIQQYCNQ